MVVAGTPLERKTLFNDGCNTTMSSKSTDHWLAGWWPTPQAATLPAINQFSWIEWFINVTGLVVTNQTNPVPVFLPKEKCLISTKDMHCGKAQWNKLNCVSCLVAFLEILRVCYDEKVFFVFVFVPSQVCVWVLFSDISTPSHQSSTNNSTIRFQIACSTYAKVQLCMQEICQSFLLDSVQCRSILGWPSLSW